MAWHQITYRTYVCRSQLFLPVCSPLRGSWRPGRASYQTMSRGPIILRRRSCGVEQFAAGHSYCINTVYFQKSSQDSSVFGFVSIINLISSSVCCTRRPCSDFMDMLRCLISCRIIKFIIIIFIPTPRLKGA